MRKKLRLGCTIGTIGLILIAILIPERKKTDNTLMTASIREIKLLRLYSSKFYSSTPPVILFECDWDWGGREEGLLYLNRDLSFKEMFLSW